MKPLFAEQEGQIRRVIACVATLPECSHAVAGSRPAHSYSLPLVSTLVECVPNFPRAATRREIDAIVDAMKINGALPARP